VRPCLKKERKGGEEEGRMARRKGGEREGGRKDEHRV
jgi:hypothetical protein